MAARRKPDSDTLVQPDLIGGASFPETPMFPNLGIDEGMIPAKILVFRIDPPDGMIMPPAPVNADEEFIESVYGGRVLKLSLRAENGRMISEKTITLNSPPKHPTQPSHQGGAPAGPADNSRALYDMQRDMVREQRTYAAEQLAMMRAEHQAGLDRAKSELELSLTRQRAEAALAIAAAKAEADAREEREQRRWDRDAKEQRDRHERDMAKIDADRKAEVARVEQSRRDDETRNQQFMLHMQNSDKEKTAVIMAALQAQNARGDSVEQMKGLAEVAQLMGGGAKDPNVEIAETAGKAITGLASIVAADREDRRGVAKGKPAGAGKVKVVAPPTREQNPGANGVAPTEAKALPASTETQPAKSMEATLQSIAAQLSAAGHDPLEVMRKVESGEYTIIDSKAAEELIEGEEEEPVAEAGAKGDAVPNGTAPVEGRGREVNARPNANGLESDHEGNGRPASEGVPGEGDG